MRAAASSAPPSGAGPLALADAKVAGNGAGAAASETSSSAASSDRSADSSSEGTSGQPFAAALASAQADTDRKPGTGAAVPAAPEGPADGSRALQDASAARLDSRLRAGSTVGTSSLKTRPETPSMLAPAAASNGSAAATPLLLAAAADSSVDSGAATGNPSPKAGGDTGAPATPSATTTKPRAGKHSQTADSLGGAALSTLLGAVAAQIGAAAPATSGIASSMPGLTGKGASADHAVAALSVAAKQLLPKGLSAEVAATSPASIGPSTAAAPTSGGETNGASGGSLIPARAADPSPSSASTAAGLAPAMQNLNAATNAASTSANASVGVPVSHSSWPSALAAQVQWMATRQVQSATLRLSPEHLGPLEVRIDVTSSQINVNFTAHHPDTRQALTQAVPQLRQLFAAGGLNLGEATVRQESRSSQQPLSPQPSSAAARSETVEPVANTAIQRVGLVDEYA